MFGNMNDSLLGGAIEALLFVSDEPVNVLTLSEMLEADPSEILDALIDLAKRRDQDGSGIRLKEVAGGWRLYTAPVYHELLEQYVLSWDTRRLSQAALETLAIIAYGQPITRLGISSIRGVNSDSSVNTLIDKGLVRESGTADAPGYPMTYSTTKTFLEKFGLRNTDDLPPLEDFAPDEETMSTLREGLSMHAHFGLVGGEAADYSLEPTEKGSAPRIDLEDGDDMQRAMRTALSDAFASSAGIVEKIDFDQLEFEE